VDLEQVDVGVIDVDHGVEQRPRSQLLESQTVSADVEPDAVDTARLPQFHLGEHRREVGGERRVVPSIDGIRTVDVPLDGREFRSGRQRADGDSSGGREDDPVDEGSASGGKSAPFRERTPHGDVAEEGALQVRLERREHRPAVHGEERKLVPRSVVPDTVPRRGEAGTVSRPEPSPLVQVRGRFNVANGGGARLTEI